MSRPIGATLAFALTWSLTVSAAGASAQEPTDRSRTAVIRGELLDGATEQPIPFALVELEGFQETLTDEEGRFQFTVPFGGRYTVVASQLGYIIHSEQMDLSDGDVLTVFLAPKPLVLSGIEVTVDRLERRRRRMAFTVRAADGPDIMRSGALNTRHLVEQLARTPLQPCGLNECLLVRGRFRTLRVVVDEVGEFGGLAALQSYALADLHSVEFIERCAMARVYTKEYVEMKARNRSAFGQNLCEYR